MNRCWVSFLTCVSSGLLILGVLLAGCVSTPTASEESVADTSPDQHAPAPLPKGGAKNIRLDGSKAVFTTERMVVEVDSGIITQIKNRVTGTSFLLDTGTTPEAFQSSLLYLEPGVTKQQQDPNVVGPPPTLEGTEVLEPRPVTLNALEYRGADMLNGDSVAYRFAGPDNMGLTVIYGLDPLSGDVLITLEGAGRRERLSGVRFGLGPVSVHGNLLLPSFHGIKAARGQEQMAKFESKEWDWPTGWPIPVVLFNDPSGGFWVHTEDPEHRFKRVRYDSTDDAAWLVAFDTLNVAPFAPHTEAKSVTWRINTFEGGWEGPIGRYKNWAYDAYDMAEKEWARPEWVDDLKLVIKRADVMPIEEMDEYLSLLSQYVEPSQVLLHTRPWAKSDIAIMPHWTIDERGGKFNRDARSMGYRTMYFANYFSITSNHPRFEEFKPYIMRDPYTNDLQGWNLQGEWSAATQVQLYYVNPASKMWQDFQVELFSRLFQEHPADGLFIDQSFVMNNDNNGLVDGMTSVEGNLEFHRALAEALPGVAIGGEGVNEITFQYESVAEFHILGLEMALDAAGKSTGWRLFDPYFDRMVPIMPEFLLPHTRPIGYHVGPGTSEFYPAWRDAVRLYRGIPTIHQPTLAELRDPSSEARRLLREIFGKE